MPCNLATAKSRRVVMLAFAGVALLLTAPGIAFTPPGWPSPGTADRAAFDVAFWANIYSGVISSFLTGLVVGFTVWGAQLLADRRRTRANLDREFSAFRGRLRTRLSRPNDHPLDKVRSLIPAGADAVAALLEYSAVDPWREYHPEQERLLALLEQFEQSHAEFALAATRLDHRLKHLVWVENARRGGPMALAPGLVTTFLDILRSYLEAPPKAGSPLQFRCPTGKPPDVINEFVPIVRDFSGDRELVQLAEELRTRMGPLSLALSELRSALPIGQAAMAHHPTDEESSPSPLPRNHP